MSILSLTSAVCSVQCAVSGLQGLHSVTVRCALCYIVACVLKDRVLLLQLLLSARLLHTIPLSMSVYFFFFFWCFFSFLCCMSTHQSLNKHSLALLCHQIPLRKRRRGRRRSRCLCRRFTAALLGKNYYYFFFNPLII